VTEPATFAELGIGAPILAALAELGYEAPTAIQARTIPVLLAGRDLVGQAQTGTGKTAAFAIPFLERLDVARAQLQALVLTPTRELAIQVAEATHAYAKHLPGLRVLPVYGGQPMHQQLRRLKAGVHVVVGTPGRILDHLRRGSLVFTDLQTIVLDEADEMLRMGFIDDVESILGQIPGPHQTALFSATMPREIRRIADRHLTDPVTVESEQKTRTVPTVEQRYLHVAERQKLEALTRVLELETPEAVLIFVGTKLGAADVAERLQARGYEAEAMHGDMNQVQRESVIRRLREGQVEIVVATDVAARGLDVDRISHVINYDMPHDPDSYVHRIGRTARAGRAGIAVLFITPREARMISVIERYTGQKVKPMKMPSEADVVARRTAVFKERLRKAVTSDDLEPYLSLVEALAEEGGFEMAEIAAAAAKLARGDQQPLGVVEPAPERETAPVGEDGMVRLFIDAGRVNGIGPGDIVGAIANEADVPGKAIGAIDIYDRFTFLEVPAEYRDRILARMVNVQIRNRPVRVKLATPTRPDDAAAAERRRGPKPSRAAGKPPFKGHGPGRGGRRPGRGKR
jgi:ATP-dependent RNA helicase DeaD